PPEPLADQAHALLERVAEKGMTKVALFGFALGIFLHLFVIYSILGESHSHHSPTFPAPQPAAGAAQTSGVSVATVTPVPTGDRKDCAAIRGTDYRSDAERQWFITNC